jgi:gliding motility-associated-like protein
MVFNPWRRANHFCLCLSLFIAATLQVTAQQLPLCQGGEELAQSCSTACIVCDLDGYSNATMQVTPGDPPPGFCTFVVHNIGWVGFIAGSVDLTFEVEVFPCTLGNSIELGIYEAPNCMNSQLVGTCNTEMIENNTYVFMNTEPLHPGCVYFLVFDNNGPAACPFTVTVTSGSASAPNPGPTPTPDGPTEICPGATVTYSVPEVFGTCEYTWTAPPGSLINGSPSPLSVQGDAGASVEITFGNSAGNICVETGNVCAGYTDACLPVTIATIPPTTLPPTSICNGTSLQWIDGEFYNATQLMSTTFQSWLGCDSVVNQQLIVRPPITTNLGTLFSCSNECVEVGGLPFCATGFYQVQLTSYLDCDSTVIFSLNQIQVNAVIAAPDTLDCLQPSVLLNGSASTSNAAYAWYNSQNMLLGTNDSLLVSSPGVYHFVVERTSGMLICRDTAWATVLGNSQLPIALAQGDTINCQGDSLQLNGSSNLPGAVFSWIGPGIDSTNQNLEDPWLNVPGTYVLTVANPLNGCAAKDTAMVTSIGLSPDLSVPASDTLDCNHPIVWLVAESATPGVVFSWMAPDSTITPADSVLAQQNGLWIALAIGPGGCTELDTSFFLLDTLPPLATATGGSLDCSGNPIAIHGSSPDSSATFSWTGPGNFMAALPDTLVVIPGQYILTVSTPNGCTASAIATVLTNTNVPNLTASANGANGTITCVQTSVDLFANSNSPGAVISWTGSGNYSAMGNFANAAIPGIYSATATTPNGCQASVNLTVPIDTAAPVVTVQGDTITCNHPQGFLFGICTDIGVIYSWSGPGIGPGNASQQNPVVSQPGVYNLMVTDLLTGCVAMAQTNIQLDAALPQLSANQPTTLSCANTSTLLWASSSNSGVSIAWSGPNGFNNANDSIQVSVPGVYTAIATDPNGCSNSLQLSVPADTLPPDLTASGGMINCAQNSVQLLGQTSTPGVSFLWNGPNGFSSTSPSPVTTEAGMFQLLGTAPNGCSTLALTLVTADFTVPVLSTNSSIQTLNCTDTLSNLQVQSSLPGTAFQWSLMGLPIGNNSNITTPLPGTYVVSGTAPNGCMASGSVVIQQDIAPPNVFAQGNTLFCNSQSVGISGGSATPGASLLWSGPGNFSSTQNMPSVSLPGNYTLTVTAPNGCTASAMAVVLPDATAPDLSVQAATTLTCTNPSTPLIASSNTTGVQYSWTGPGNFAATGPSTQTQAAGLYTVQVTAPNGCSNLQTITVAIDTLAPLATASGGTITCTNPTATLNGSSNTNGVQYLWSGPNNFSATQASVSADDPGLYVLLLTAANGCTGTSSAQVFQDTLAPDLALNGNTLLTCTQTTTTLNANSATSGVSWSWTGPGNFTATGTVITVSLPGNYLATASAPNGCIASTAILVTQNSIPPTALALGGQITCSAPTLALSGQSNDPGATFHWEGPNQFIANGPMPTASLPGVYMLTVTGTNGCKTSAAAMVTADQSPPAFALTGNTITCFLPSITASATGFPSGTTFNWSGPAGFQQSGALVMISVPGSYQVTAQGSNGCTASQMLAVPADLVAPQIELQGGALNCRDTVVQILAVVVPANASLAWSGPQQNLPPEAEISVGLPGLYTLTATSANGCTKASDVMVDEIIPIWSVDLGPDQTVLEGTFVNIQAITDLPDQDVADIVWTPAFNCTQCLMQVFKAKDSVFLQIAIEDENGCIKTDGLQLNVRKRGEIFIPNVFSPDGDGLNDEFRVFAGNPAILIRSLQIYDRWGSLVFSQENFHPDETRGGWNGTHRGSLLRPAVFVWSLEVEYEDGSTEFLSGDVLLKL